MIKTKSGAVSLEGSRAELYADVACIIQAIKMAFEDKSLDKEGTEKFLREAFEDGIKGIDEIETKEGRLEILKELLDGLSDLLKDFDPDDDWTKEDG